MGGPLQRGHFTFWTILFGLVVGIPIFITKEVYNIWSNLGLPEIHYTVMSSIMMLIAIGLHLGISAATRQSPEENTTDLVWNSGEAREELFRLESPIYLDRTLLSVLLILCMGGMIWWFW
ncbi:solute:Na+ symporter, SSS family [Palleronia salina]|uniref:Solute:Na+ symporter, SSS family n=1 Tax=Palleronia salina TaxID=313368 RepID=A0A1M6BR04_9RHOB|nr:hypothetical protein [Palleronia salina]SHI51152.1 solute:Na+ symporter, SSS family [Palleronia salina]